jgi:hypothetical protein
MKRLVLVVIVCLVLATGVAGAAELVVDNPSPVRGQQTFVRLTGVDDAIGWQANVTYRPNSQTSQTKPLGAFGADAKLVWLPTDSCIAQIKATSPDGKTSVSTNAAVRFPSPPISGIVILLVAGLILFGGAGYSLAKAMKE